MQSDSKVRILQLFLNREVEKLSEEGWTATHGHFLIMGGFVLVRNGQETVLDYESFVNGDLAFEVAFPTITAREILDKSRGDFLSKSIAILQSIWFIVECITRGKEGLALTELELVTLALASLNGVMYFLWWDKPLGVKEPVKVYLRNEDPPKRFLESYDEEVCKDENKLHYSRYSLPNIGSTIE